MAPYCAIPRDYLSDTSLLCAVGFWVSEHDQLGAIPLPPLSLSRLESMRGTLRPSHSVPGEKGLSGPISRDIAILSLRYPISRDTFSGKSAFPQNGAIPPPWYLISHRHICAIPHFATYRAIIVRYPTKASTKEFCDTIATSIARYEKYRYWASKKKAAIKKKKARKRRCL